jgi:hypothetical protein
VDPTTFSFADLNWLGLGLAVLANMLIGFVWYLPSLPTGRIWARDMGMRTDMQPTPGILARGLALGLVSAFLLMFVFAHTNMAYEDAFRNEATGGTAGYELTVADGLTAALFTWLGFFVPVQLTSVAWEGRPWSLFAVNAGYWLVTLLAAGVLLTTVGA